MAAKCAHCGRADLLQADVVNYQCLACGGLTTIDGERKVEFVPQYPKLSNIGAPVVELHVSAGERPEEG